MNRQEFFNYLRFEKRYSEHTLVSYQSDLNQFFTYLSTTYGEMNINDISHVHIRSWLVSLMEADVSARSINRKLSSLKSYYKFLQRKDLVKTDPFQKIQAPKLSKRLPEFVEQSGMENLWELLPSGEDFPSARDRIVIILLYSTGMRRAELLSLKEKDIDLSTNQLKVLGKGGKERIIPFGQKLREEIDTYLKVKNENGISDSAFITTNRGKPAYPKLIYNIVKENLSLVSSLNKKSPHVLRHTFATHLSNEGADLNAIKELLGHSNLSATQVYTHNTIEKLKDIHKQSHPKA